MDGWIDRFTTPKTALAQLHCVVKMHQQDTTQTTQCMSVYINVKNCHSIIMCKAHRWVTHIKTTEINFITSRATDIIWSSYYIHSPWGDEIYFCRFLYVSFNDGPYTSLWTAVCYIYICSVSTSIHSHDNNIPNKWLLCWNYTSGFNFGVTVIIGMWFGIGLQISSELDGNYILWQSINFSSPTQTFSW